MSTFADLDEARRFVEMKRAGLATIHDGETALDLIASLVDEDEGIVSAALRAEYAQGETDAVAEATAAEEATESRVREELLTDPESLAEECSVQHLMRALESAIERERREEVVAEVKHVRDVLERTQAERDDLWRENAQMRRRRKKPPAPVVVKESTDG